MPIGKIASYLAGIVLLLAPAPAIAQQTATDSLHLFFDWGKSTLTLTAKQQLDRGLYKDFFGSGQFRIFGYTDASGPETSNLQLSEARIAAVRHYLRDSLHLQLDYVSQSGLGETQADPQHERNERDRLVTIVRMVPTSRNFGKPDTAVSIRPFHKIFLGKCTDCPPAFVDITNRVNENAYRLFKQNIVGDPFADTSTGWIKRSGYSLRSKGNPLFSKQGLLRQVASGKPAATAHVSIELALNYALEGNKDSVFYYLNRALDSCKGTSCDEIWQVDLLGFYQFEPYHTTTDWKTIEARLLNHYRQTYSGSRAATHLPLLLAAGADQSVRARLYTTDPRLPSIQQRVHQANHKLIRRYLAQEGYTRLSAAGSEIEEATFLLVQHTEDSTLQKQVLDDMKQLRISGKPVDLEHMALLTDRMQVITTGTQTFGTQIGADGHTHPIRDIRNVNARRAAYGLLPLKL